METRLGRFPAQVERPEPIKFAWPIVLLPELFTTRRHLAILLGYLATIGWEVYAPDFRAVAGRNGTPPLAEWNFEETAAIVGEALDALDREAIVLGHGFGGLLSLKAAGRPRVKASVAFAPLVPGRKTRFIMRPTNLPSIWLKRPLKPPVGKPLMQMLTNVEPFQREGLIKALIPDASRAAVEVARGQARFIQQDSKPKLIVAGQSDPLAPAEAVAKFAAQIGAEYRCLAGQGHWLIGGRALERAVGEAHRFLVRSLGQDLLLLYPEESREDSERDDS